MVVENLMSKNQPMVLLRYESKHGVLMRLRYWYDRQSQRQLFFDRGDENRLGMCVFFLGFSQVSSF